MPTRRFAPFYAREEFKRLGLTLTNAEEALMAAVGTGEIWMPEGFEFERPTEPIPANTLRAKVIRVLAICDALALGEPIHEHGVQVLGAWIEGELVLTGCESPRDLLLVYCHFTNKPNFRGAVCASLTFNHSQLSGFCADGLQVTGNVNFYSAFLEGELRLLGARIGGQFGLTGTTLNHPDGDALNLANAQIDGDVFLREATIQGKLRLEGARIGGQLDLNGATLSNSNGTALICRTMQVAGIFFFDPKEINSTVDMRAAELSTLIDDLDKWPAGECFLEGMTYTSLITDQTANARIRWLEKQHPIMLKNTGAPHHDFRPQSWIQLAKVFTDSGKRGEARKVLHRKMVLQNKALRAGWRRQGEWWSSERFVGKLHIFGNRLWCGVLLPVGYGYKPFRGVGLLALLIVMFSVFFHFAHDNGAITPASDVVLTDHHWVGCVEGKKDRQDLTVACWRETPVARHYETFNGFLYALDQFIPLVPFGQDEEWAPSPAVPGWGGFAWWGRVAAIILGYYLTLLIALSLASALREDEGEKRAA